MPLTPFPVGKMPPTVQRWPEGPPYGRLLLSVPETVEYLPDGRQLVKDDTSGEYFAIRFDVDCGAGCHCAAEAEWLPSYDPAVLA